MIGANTGIGKETALDLVKRGGRVILACRSLSKGNRNRFTFLAYLKINTFECLKHYKAFTKLFIFKCV